MTPPKCSLIDSAQRAVANHEYFGFTRALSGLRYVIHNGFWRGVTATTLVACDTAVREMNLRGDAGIGSWACVDSSPVGGGSTKRGSRLL